MVVRYLTGPEALRVKDGAISVRDQAIIGILLHTGMRIGECAGLQVKDFDEASRTVRIERIVVPVTKTIRAIREGHDNGAKMSPGQKRNLYKPARQLGIYLQDGSIRKVLPKDLPALLEDELKGTKEFVRVGTKSKGERGRVVPLTDASTWTRIRAELEGRKPTDWAWRAGAQRGRPNHWGGRLSYPAIREVVKRAMIRAQIPEEKQHPHALRHTFAVSLLKGGGDLRTLQRIGGWSNITMVAHYLDLVTEDLVEISAKVELGY